ncbi:MAG: multiheme c-type cytochrome [Lacibacter sp.]
MKFKLIIVSVSLVLFIVLFNYCTTKETAPGYAGTETCQSCHQKEFALYTLSDHYHAMDTVSPQTVKGNFNNNSFIYHGDTALFYRKGNNYFVRTTDSTGIKKEFIISYTFGWQPLQQYLVRFDDGRMQVLPFCWDTRAKEKGGQRWFHLYDKEKIVPGDELFWMGYNQNWNYMCADCHTTAFEKNFDDSSNSFHSRWKENKVSCESCHGPASLHLKWAKTKKNDPLKGFRFSLANKPVQWNFDSSNKTAQPSEISINHNQIETCARCHARATRFTDAYTHGNSFLQSHTPVTASTINYYIDGQIREEDYEYASFLQSKMYAKGVSCTNCHDAHSMKVKAIGNALCNSCHAAGKYSAAIHTHHKENSTGSQCINCHMPVTTYMVVDDRRDHSIRIPRPDHSLTTNTPNACNKCHTDKSVQWAASSFTKWYKDKLPAEKTYAELLYNISSFVKESEASLFQLLSSKNYPAIIKATALEQYNVFATARTREQVMNYISDNDPFLRLNALKALASYPQEMLVPAATPLLADEVAAVRYEAMVTVAPYSNTLDEETKKQFTAVMKEYLTVQQKLSHRPEGYLNRGIILSITGNNEDAERTYTEGIRRFPAFLPFYINLADHYRQTGNEQKSKELIGKGLALQPSSADLNYAAGLWYIRQKDYKTGMMFLQKAASLNPSATQLVYAYATGLFSTGEQEKAIKMFEDYLHTYGNNPTIVDGLISFCNETNQKEKAAQYSMKRKEVFGY